MTGEGHYRPQVQYLLQLAGLLVTMKRSQLRSEARKRASSKKSE